MKEVVLDAQRKPVRGSSEFLEENSNYLYCCLLWVSTVWKDLARCSCKWAVPVNLLAYENVVLISSSFYSLICVWEWLKALLLSVCCTLCGSFKVWPYRSWHLNAKENAGQACSSWGSCHQTIALWNNGCFTWIQAESLFPSLLHQSFK
jgi:hypothetical protein